MTRLEKLAMDLMLVYVTTPTRKRRDREELADALIMVGERDPQALGRAMRAAGFRAEDLA